MDAWLSVLTTEAGVRDMQMRQLILLLLLLLLLYDLIGLFNQGLEPMLWCWSQQPAT